jgi:serine/threonine protein kinase
MLTACGTPEYIAPEVIAALEDTDDERIPYSAKVDIWAVGVICYVLLCGYQPFQLENQKAMYSAIRKGKYGFPSPEWDHVSDEAKAFIRFVLKLDPASRPPAAECLRQPWVASIELRRTQSLSGASLRLQENLARYTEQRKKNRLQQVMTAAQRGLRRLSIRSMESMTALIDPIRRGSKATQTSQISLPPSSASANDSLEASRHLSSAGPPGGHVDQSPTDGAIERSTSAGSETPWVDGELDAPEAPTV